jgi:hypothetical protein
MLRELNDKEPVISTMKEDTARSAQTIRSVRFAVAPLCGLMLLCGRAAAQELEPRAYSPSPVGANFVLLGTAYSAGDVTFDPSIPITNVDAKLTSASLGYGRTFGLFGRSASAGIFQPYVWGRISGDIFEQSRSVDRSGVADTRLRLAINLLGGPALTPAEFAKRRPGRTLGTSIVVVAPTGQSYSDKLVNIGTNRWAFKPELGFSQPVQRWSFDAYAAAWLFTDNDEFFGGQVREQDPIGALQGHISYTINPRLWLAGDATFYAGGRTTVGGTKNADYQANSRFGITFSAPVRRRNSLKVSWTTGGTTRIGGSFDTITAAWQFLWFD